MVVDAVEDEAAGDATADAAGSFFAFVASSPSTAAATATAAVAMTTTSSRHAKANKKAKRTNKDGEGDIDMYNRLLDWWLEITAFVIIANCLR
jgi:hypothetical protein